MSERALLTTRLVCVECHRTSNEQARGWRLYLLTIERELFAYCPDCAAREFGDA
jgi:hypothetical protein